MFKTLTVAYWMGSVLDGMDIPNNTQIEYDETERKVITEKALSLGYNVMLTQYQDKDNLILWIDTRRFNQR